jgi:hypothetical protein
VSSEAQVAFLTLLVILVLAAQALYVVAAFGRLDDRLDRIESRLVAIENRLGP